MDREWRRHDADAKARVRMLPSGATPAMAPILRRIEELSLTFDVRTLPASSDTAVALLALALSVAEVNASPKQIRSLIDTMLSAAAAPSRSRA